MGGTGERVDENDASAAQRLRPIASEKGAGPAAFLRSKSMEMKRKEIERLKGALNEVNAANETAYAKVQQLRESAVACKEQLVAHESTAAALKEAASMHL